MQSRFYVSHNGLDLGPFSVDQIKEKIQSGDLLPIDYMFVEEKDDWVLISEFVDLKSSAAAPPENPSPAAPEPEGETKTDMTAIEPKDELSEDEDPYPDIDTSPRIIALQSRGDEDTPPALNIDDTEPDTDINFSDISDPDNKTDAQQPTFHLGGQQQDDSLTDPYIQSGLDEGTDPHMNIDHELTYPSFQIPTPEETQEAQAAQPLEYKVENKSNDEDLEAPPQAQPEPALETAAHTPDSEEQEEPETQTESELVTAEESAPQQTESPLPEAVTQNYDEDPDTHQEIESDTFVNGQATLQLSLKKAKSITISLSDSFKTGLQMSNEARVQVKPAPGTQVILTGPDHCVAGEPAEFHLEVHDDYGNHDESFSGKVEVELDGHATTPNETISIDDGRATIKISNTKAEEFKIQLSDTHSTGLKMPEPKELECVAGPAQQVVLDSPKEATAGQPVEVKLKVVDAYGNVAKDFKGKVSLNINGVDYTAKAS